MYMHITSYFERESDEETSPRTAEVRSTTWRLEESWKGGQAWEERVRWKEAAGGWLGREGVRDEREQGPPFFICIEYFFFMAKCVF